MKKKELVGVKEIARRAGVSIATVDRVLNNRTGVSEKTKKNILEIIKELDYQPNIMARRLASRKTLKFGVLIPAVSGETGYWDAPLLGIKQASNEIKDYGITVETYFFDQNNRDTFVANYKEMLKQDLDGIVLAPMFEAESLAFTAACSEKDIPYVFINSDMDDQNSLCYIGPDLYQSGYLAAHLIKYFVKESQKVLIVNVSKEIDLHHHLLRKEEGFRTYFNSNYKNVILQKVDIRQTDYKSLSEILSTVLAEEKTDIIFVTNSRVSSIAKYLEEKKQTDIKLIGYDFLPENINFLKKGTIDFLICQKPQQQGYKGIMALYSHLVHSATIEKQQYMPIDIITSENHQYYKN